LFLRAFTDDQVLLRRARSSWIGWISQLGQGKTNLDQMLLEEGSLYGPVVALGKPGDKWPPYGAARGYFLNTMWQDAVVDLAANSAAVVICVDDTDSVWWEVEHLALAKQLGKALFLLHPKHLNRPAANKLMFLKLLERLYPQSSEMDLFELLGQEPGRVL